MPDKKSNNSNDNLMSVLAYIGILVLIPLIAGGKSKAVRFHTNQGLVLLLAEVLLGVINFIIASLFFSSLGGAAIGSLLSLVTWVLGLGILVLAIMGIINAVNGEQKPLPLIGGIKLIK